VLIHACELIKQKTLSRWNLPKDSIFDEEYKIKEEVFEEFENLDRVEIGKLKFDQMV